MLTWDYSRAGTVVMAIFTLVLSIASTGVRFWSRAVVLRGQYGLDDWLCLVALVPTIGLLIMGLWLLYIGVGTPITELEPNQITRIFKGFYFASLLFDLGMGFAKLSALAFYRRIFGGYRKSHMFAWTIPFGIAVFITVGWLLMAIFYSLFRCVPVRENWSLAPTGCVSTPAGYLTNMGITNVFTDVVIVLLPIPQLWGLKMDLKRKISVISLLVIAYSIPLISIGRLVTVIVLKNQIDDDFTYTLIPVGLWILAEPPVSIFAISLPGAFQLYKRARRYGIRSLLSSRDYYLRPGLARYCYQPTYGTKSNRMREPVSDLEPSSAGNVSSHVRAATLASSKKPSLPEIDDVWSDEVNDLQPLERIYVTTEIKVNYAEDFHGSSS